MHDEWWWMMLMNDDEWWWMRFTNDDEWWRWISSHVSCMTNLHDDSHVGAFRDVSALQRFSLKQRGGTTAQLTDDFKQTNDGGSSNAHRSLNTERSPYRQMCSDSGAFAISNTFIAGLGIHIKYCLDHGDHGYCIGHICCSTRSEHGGTIKYKLERSGCRRRSMIFFTSQFASQSLHSGFGP